jgi:hypothetical protein
MPRTTHDSLYFANWEWMDLPVHRWVSCVKSHDKTEHREWARHSYRQHYGRLTSRVERKKSCFMTLFIWNSEAGKADLGGWKSGVYAGGDVVTGWGLQVHSQCCFLIWVPGTQLYFLCANSLNSTSCAFNACVLHFNNNNNKWGCSIYVPVPRGVKVRELGSQLEDGDTWLQAAGKEIRYIQFRGEPSL